MKDPIELKGLWWLPESADRKLPGTLTFSQEDGGHLELIGVFGTGKTPQTEQPPIILGLTHEGKPVTLHKCFNTGLTYPLLGMGAARYHVSTIFDGVQFGTAEQIRFHEIRGRYTDLDAWVNIYGFKIDHAIDGNFELNIRYDTPSPRFFDVGEDLSVGIAFESSGPKVSIVQTDVAIAQSAYLVITSKHGDLRFDELFAKLGVFSCLVQMAVQRMTYPISILAVSEPNAQQRVTKDANIPDTAIYYEPVEADRHLREKLPQEMLFTFGDLGAEQINGWFRAFDKYQAPIYLYRALFYSNRLFIDTRFLYIVQALESLHSIMFDNELLPHDQFLARKETVLRSVPSHLAEWAESALEDANYKRLKLKISELLGRKKELFKECIPDMALFADRVKDTRNEFTHHNKRKRTFQMPELHSAIDLLTMLFEAYLLEIIGFSDEKINELLAAKIASHQTGWRHLRSIKK